MNETGVPPSPRTRVRRIAENADYASSTVQNIVDAAYLCQIAFHDGENTHCIPTACWRDGEYLYVHGSNGGRLTRQLLSPRDVCVNITHLDGLVLARSAFNHSMNYRSVVIYGRFELVSDEAEKRRLMDVFMHKIAPGREHEARPGNAKEFAATSIMRIPLAEAAAKVRSGGVQDDEDDMAWPAWAGVLPMTVQALPPEVDAQNAVPTPAYVHEWGAQ
ncbi:hypothetical protein SAMN02745857_02277 [Andreprevotia lacus DSM 23236]|jgi:nitroimidazol reductase NimA-like FMN-containing flavoprotein (pyridoxamine 5'-phosphate oxidase superfamily)|uniref:Nitroimidazol reductase NimA, pyridoxamine 5'-phosphate oxidase superfamily n=1 Tax=Andreprevotia lacus DSM 23236 TaxID=1121001 RepID=A0A1W1XPJ2_9NEIS|nr:pyridoxamine 5'-phosphate oxidase family protein [Andreprevotia lacus]SMC25772.1 hypothetical protein SAMN02745857_02277 [Andreprevotia lacus DSM 23236]